MNTENSGVNIGGLGATGSGEQEVKANIFTDSTWPGLQNMESSVIASQNMPDLEQQRYSAQQTQQQLNSVGQIQAAAG